MYKNLLANAGDRFDPGPGKFQMLRSNIAWLSLSSGPMSATEATAVAAGGSAPRACAPRQGVHTAGGAVLG